MRDKAVALALKAKEEALKIKERIDKLNIKIGRKLLPDDFREFNEAELPSTFLDAPVFKTPVVEALKKPFKHLGFKPFPRLYLEKFDF